MSTPMEPADEGAANTPAAESATTTAAPSSLHPYDEETDKALDVVSVMYACDLLKRADEDAEWENYPDLGENDFRQVVARVVKLGDASPPIEEYKAAYAHLASRANGVEA